MDDGDGELQKMSLENTMFWQVNRNIWPSDNTKMTRSLSERPVIHTNFKEGT